MLLGVLGFECHALTVLSLITGNKGPSTQISSSQFLPYRPGKSILETGEPRTYTETFLFILPERTAILLLRI